MRVLAALAPDQVQVVLGRQVRNVHFHVAVCHQAVVACRLPLTSAHSRLGALGKSASFNGSNSVS